MKVHARRARLSTAVTSGRRVRVFMTAFGREILDDDLIGLAAELSYRWLFALFPTFVAYSHTLFSETFSLALLSAGWVALVALHLLDGDQVVGA